MCQERHATLLSSTYEIKLEVPAPHALHTDIIQTYFGWTEPLAGRSCDCDRAHSCTVTATHHGHLCNYISAARGVTQQPAAAEVKLRRVQTTGAAAVCTEMHRPLQSLHPDYKPVLTLVHIFKLSSSKTHTSWLQWVPVGYVTTCPGASCVQTPPCGLWPLNLLHTPGRALSIYCMLWLMGYVVLVH